MTEVATGAALGGWIGVAVQPGFDVNHAGPVVELQAPIVGQSLGHADDGRGRLLFELQQNHGRRDPDADGCDVPAVVLGSEALAGALTFGIDDREREADVVVARRSAEVELLIPSALIEVALAGGALTERAQIPSAVKQAQADERSWLVRQAKELVDRRLAEQSLGHGRALRERCTVNKQPVSKTDSDVKGRRDQAQSLTSPAGTAKQPACSEVMSERSAPSGARNKPVEAMSASYECHVGDVNVMDGVSDASGYYFFVFTTLIPKYGKWSAANALVLR